MRDETILTDFELPTSVIVVFFKSFAFFGDDIEIEPLLLELFGLGPKVHLSGMMKPS